jgi:hypothetical protein
METENINSSHKDKGNIAHGKKKKPDYYTTAGKKVLDFIIGFFGPLILYFFSSLLFSFFYPSGTLLSLAPALFNFIFLVIILLVLLIVFAQIGRRFISIGISSVLLIFLIAFGSCLSLLSAYR